jgi:hypothetical protein
MLKVQTSHLIWKLSDISKNVLSHLQLVVSQERLYALYSDEVDPSRVLSPEIDLNCSNPKDI